jgi:hypothetical protein
MLCGWGRSSSATFPRPPFAPLSLTATSRRLAQIPLGTILTRQNFLHLNTCARAHAHGHARGRWSPDQEVEEVQEAVKRFFLTTGAGRAINAALMASCPACVRGTRE